MENRNEILKRHERRKKYLAARRKILAKRPNKSLDRSFYKDGLSVGLLPDIAEGVGILGALLATQMASKQKTVDYTTTDAKGGEVLEIEKYLEKDRLQP